MASVPQACLRSPNVKGLVSILQTIKSPNKGQVCILSINKDGISVRWEDNSKSLQSSVWLHSELFARYSCQWVRKSLGLDFKQFVDTLNVFATGTGAELILRYPGPNDELICEMTEDGSVAQFCTYARLGSLELPLAGDLMDAWENPASFFLMDGVLLKEAVEDLEWSSGGQSVHVHLHRDPPSVTMSAHGLADLRVTLPPGKLDGFQCSAPDVHHCYKHKHLRTAFTQLPQSKEGSSPVSTKVSIDQQGLMKVTHMLSFAGGEVHGGNFNLHSATADSQRSAAANHMGIIQFMLVAEDDMEFDGQPA